MNYKISNNVFIIGHDTNHHDDVCFYRAVINPILWIKYGYQENNVIEIREANESFDHILKRLSPDYVVIDLENELCYEWSLKVVNLGYSVFILNIHILNSKQLMALCNEASLNSVDINILNPCMALNVKDTLIDSLKHGSIEVNFIRDIHKSNLLNYLTPNNISREYSNITGVFQRNLYYLLFILVDRLHEGVVIEVGEYTNNVFPCKISDSIRVVIKTGDILTTINLGYKKHNEFFVVNDVNNNSVYKIKENKRNKSFKYINNILFNILYFIAPGYFTNRLIKKTANKYFININEYVENHVLVLDIIENISSKLMNIYPVFDNFIPKYTNEDKLKPLVLITGSSGALGTELINQLTIENYRIRCLVRKLSKTSFDKNNKYEIFYGDVEDYESLNEAFNGVDYVVHAAADTLSTRNSKSTIEGTRNIVKLSKKYSIKKLVYISTCNVYKIHGLKRNSEINENSKLEDNPELRGLYTYTKLIADKLIQDEINKNNIRAVCIRPGTFFGKGIPYITPMVGFNFRNKIIIVIGYKEQIIPFVSIKNVANAIIKILNTDSCVNVTYNLIDRASLSKSDYVTEISKLYKKPIVVHVPYSLFMFMVSIQEYILKILGINPFLTRYRVVASQSCVKYDSSRIYRDLNWHGPYDTREMLINILAIKS